TRTLTRKWFVSVSRYGTRYDRPTHGSLAGFRAGSGAGERAARTSVRPSPAPIRVSLRFIKGACLVSSRRCVADRAVVLPYFAPPRPYDVFLRPANAKRAPDHVDLPNDRAGPRPEEGLPAAAADALRLLHHRLRRPIQRGVRQAHDAEGPPGVRRQDLRLRDG